MKSKLIFALAVTALSVGCGDKSTKKDNTVAASANGVEVSTETTGKIEIAAQASCADPFQSGGQEISIRDMIRNDGGTYVLVQKIGYSEGQASLPSADVLNSLTVETRRQLDEEIQGKQQTSVIVNLNSLEWKTADVGAIKVPFELTCTTQKPAEKISTANSQLSETSNVSLNMTLPYIIEGDSLIARLGASSHFKLRDGKEQKFAAELSKENTGSSMLKVEQDAETLKAQGLKFRFFKLSGDSFKLRVEIEKDVEQKMSLSNKASQSANGQVIEKSAQTKELTVPMHMLIVIEGVYELRK